MLQALLCQVSLSPDERNLARYAPFKPIEPHWVAVWITDILSASNYVPVADPEEIAFALCLFVEFVEGRLTPAPHRRERLHDMETAELRCGQARTSPMEKALAAVWDFYGDDGGRGDICARIAAFYLLMSRSGGAAVAEWIIESPDGSGDTALSPELIAAIATAPLGKDLPYDEESFVTFLRTTATVEHCAQ